MCSYVYITRNMPPCDTILLLLLIGTPILLCPFFPRRWTCLCPSSLRRRLRAQLGAAAADGALLSHTIEEALAFDRQLDREVGYAECPARFPGQSWPR